MPLHDAAAGDTFEVVAREWFEKFSKNGVPGHADKIIRRLELYICPWIGNRSISKIEAPDILACVRRVEAKGNLETAWGQPRAQRPGYLESIQRVPEPHAFKAVLTPTQGQYATEFSEQHDNELDSRDHNMRAAYIHVVADAAVSVPAIVGLTLAKIFGWLWMDPLAGFIGALVSANWSYGLIRDTGAIRVDSSPGETLANKVCATVEAAGDTLVDLHIGRLGPGHCGAVISVVSQVAQRSPALYHALLGRFKGLSHITVEIHTPLAG